MKLKIELFVAAILFAFGWSAIAQGTAFTYQGRLNDGVNPANGSYDLSFAVYDSLTNGTQQGNPVTNSATAVSNGLFTVVLDFGNQYPGANRWLEIAVRTNGSTGFFVLNPRQALTPAPYAITAGSVVSDGLAAGTYGNAVTLNNSGNEISGAFSGNGGNVTNVNAATLNGISSGGFWQTNGNMGANPTNGAFIGTSDNLPLEVRVNSQRALRIEPNTFSPNIIGGYSGNIISNGFYGGVIVGGGYGSNPNSVGADFATVLGGYGNVASGPSSLAMGHLTIASGSYSTAMGDCFVASGRASTAIGELTTASGDYSTAMGNNTVASGASATATGNSSTASGASATTMGYHTLASGFGATALGASSQALHNNTFVWSDGTAIPAFASSAANQFLVYASGGVGINTTNPLGDALCVNGDGRIDAQPAAWNEGLAINCPTNMAANGGFGGIHFHSTGRGQGFSSGSIKWSEMYNYAPEIGNAVGGGLAFIRNNSSTTLYLSSSGNVGVGTTAPDALLTVNGTADKPGGGSWSTYSDARLKDVRNNFTPGLDALEKIQPVRYRYKADNSLKLPSQPEFIGVVAQQLQQAVPDAVQTNSSGYLTVNNDPVIWTTVNAVKELNHKLETENAELKARLDRLEKLLTQTSR